MTASPDATRPGPIAPAAARLPHTAPLAAGRVFPGPVSGSSSAPASLWVLGSAGTARVLTEGNSPCAG